MKQYFVNNKSDVAKYTHVFQILIKLRQFCCHPALVFGNSIGNIGETDVKNILGQFLSAKMKDNYKNEAIMAMT